MAGRKPAMGGDGRRLVAIDARMLTRPLRGMPLYLQNLCRELPRQMADTRFLFFINTGFEHNVPAAEYRQRLEEFTSLSNVEILDMPYPSDIYWEQVLLPWATFKKRVRLLFMPGNRRPFFSFCPTVVALHDVMEWLYPARLMAAPEGAGARLRFYFWRERLYVWFQYRFALRFSQAMVTVSHHAADEIQRHLRIPRDRITVAYHGIPPGYRTSPGSSPPREQRNYCLMLGGDSYQKNPEGALAAWARVPPDLRRAHPLRIAGFVGASGSPLLQALEKHALKSEVEIIPWVGEAELIGLFRGAALLIFLSRHEGFGFPLVQAMAAGTPVVHSNATSLGELGGNAGIAVAPEDTQAAAEGIRTLLTDAAKWEACRQAGWKQSAGFEWNVSARIHAEIFANYWK